jgi:hypothetical protein
VQVRHRAAGGWAVRPVCAGKGRGGRRAAVTLT